MRSSSGKVNIPTSKQIEEPPKKSKALSTLSTRSRKPVENHSLSLSPISVNKYELSDSDNNVIEDLNLNNDEFNNSKHVQGPPGARGREGPPGEQGIQGLRGEQGPNGKQGPPGLSGPPGKQGPTGPSGHRGSSGEQGLPGPRGKQGEPGPRGEQGEVGPQGESGEQGLPGPRGKQGESGEQGEQGEQGEVGPQGEVGEVGPQGEQGEVGEVGPQGEQGKTVKTVLYNTELVLTDSFTNIVTFPYDGKSYDLTSCIAVFNNTKDAKYELELVNIEYDDVGETIVGKLVSDKSVVGKIHSMTEFQFLENELNTLQLRGKSESGVKVLAVEINMISKD